MGAPSRRLATLVVVTALGCATGGGDGEVAGNGTGGDVAGTGGGAGGAPDAGAPSAADGGSATFVSLAVPLGAPLDRSRGTTVSTAPPQGWLWYEIAGAVCRDMSRTGFY